MLVIDFYVCGFCSIKCKLALFLYACDNFAFVN